MKKKILALIACCALLLAGALAPAASAQDALPVDVGNHNDYGGGGYGGGGYDYGGRKLWRRRWRWFHIF